MTKKRSYRRYSPEFKREAIKRGCDEGMTDAAVCKELGISARQFRRWRDELHLLGADAFPGQGRTRDEEVTRLKRELAKVTQERDFLKQAALESFFGVMKRERANRINYRTKAEAQSDLFEYIEVFYNRKRRHGYLGGSVQNSVSQ